MSDLPPPMDAVVDGAGSSSESLSATSSEDALPSTLPPSLPSALAYSTLTLPAPPTVNGDILTGADGAPKSTHDDQTDPVVSPGHGSGSLPPPPDAALPIANDIDSSIGTAGVATQTSKPHDAEMDSSTGLPPSSPGHHDGSSAANNESLADATQEPTETASHIAPHADAENSALNGALPTLPSDVAPSSSINVSHDASLELHSSSDATGADGERAQSDVLAPSASSGDSSVGAADAAIGEDGTEEPKTESEPPVEVNPLDLMAVSSAPKLNHVTATRARGPAGGRRPPTRGVVVESKPQSQPDQPSDLLRVAELTVSSESEAAPSSSADSLDASAAARKMRHVSLGAPMLKFDVSGVKLKSSASRESAAPAEPPHSSADDFATNPFGAHLKKTGIGVDFKKGGLEKSRSVSECPALPPPVPSGPPPALPSHAANSGFGLPPPISVYPPASSSSSASNVASIPPLSPSTSGESLKISKKAKPSKADKTAYKEIEKAKKKEAKDVSSPKLDKKMRHASLGAPITGGAILAAAGSNPDLHASPTGGAPQKDHKKGAIASLLTSFFKSRPKREQLVEKGVLYADESSSSSSSSSSGNAAVASSSGTMATPSNPPPSIPKPMPSTAAPSPPHLASAAPPSPILPSALPPPSPSTPSKAPSKKIKESGKQKSVTLPTPIHFGGTAAPQSAPPYATTPPPPPSMPPTLSGGPPRSNPPVVPPSAAPPPPPPFKVPKLPSLPPPMPGALSPAVPNSLPPPLPSSAPPPLPSSGPPPLPSSGTPSSTPPSAPPPTLPPWKPKN